MTAKVIQLSRSGALRTPVGHVIRTGETSYRQLEYLHAEGRLPARAVIVDASKARFQTEFIRALRDSGAEVTLDTKVAELSEIGKFSGTAKGTPWAAADEGRPLSAADFEVGATIDLFGKIARSAVELGMTAVLAPTHFLRLDAYDNWLPIDRRSVTALRAALDREGGKHIAIDYPLIAPHTSILGETYRLRIMQALHDLPVDNLVLRLSGFGADAGPLTIRRTLIAIHEFHPLGYPILLDYVGGLVGLGALAFGVVSGIAHGIGERDRFHARSWHKPPKERTSETSFRRTMYVPLPGLDRSFRKADLEAIASTPRGRRLVACDDRQCCARGLSSMLDNPRAHIARQKFRAISELFQVPDARRIGHFLNVEMRNAERKAGDLARLSTGNDRLDKALAEGRKRIDSMIRMYEALSERDRPFPPALRRRQAPGVPTEWSSA